LKKHVKSILFLTAAPISQVIRSLIIVFLMSKFMTLSEVGIWGQILAIHAFLYMLINLNLTHSMSRFFPSQKEDIKKVSSIFFGIFIIVVLSSIIVGAVLIVFNDFFSQVFFNSKNFTNVILLLSVFILLENIFNNIYSYLRSMQEYYYQSMLMIYRTLFELIIVGGGIIYFHYIDELTLDIVFYLFFSSTLLTITIGYFILHVKKLIIYTRPDFNFLREYLSFGLPQLPGSLSHWIINLSDRLIIGFYLGIEALGVYFIANRIGMILTFPLTPLGTLLYAEGSKKHDNGEYLDEKKILTLYSVFIVSFAIIVYYLAYNFIDYMIDEKYKETLDIVFLMMFSLTLLNIFSVLNIFDSIKKNSIKIGKIWTIIALINLGLNFYLIPSIGITGAVYSSIISYSVGILLSAVYEK
jgi:O-antigen/teichoic acid export membrane protein